MKFQKKTELDQEKVKFYRFVANMKKSIYLVGNESIIVHFSLGFSPPPEGKAKGFI